MQSPTLDSIERKLKEIYDDLADNITFIYGRQDLHLAIDLVYHSPLRLIYDKKIVKKGYPEILIIGDTRTGKTQCTEALVHHYGVGVCAGGESMSFAGLIGGCQQLGKEWSITWGVIPQNNRRLVVIDEAGGMKEEDIAKMSSVRSQGIAEITKIKNQKTEARTRMLWLANPRDSMTVNEFSSGVDMVKTLVSSPEDIARWDMIMVVSKDEIKFSAMATGTRVKTPHRYTADLCHSLVLWAWCRSAEEIHITEEAEHEAFHLAEKMCNKYCTDFTVVNDAEQRIKIIRLATSLAARLYSTTNGKDIVVHKNHVRYIYDFLNRTYDSKYFRFDQWSINHTAGRQIVNVEEVEEFCREIGPQGCMKFHERGAVRLQEIENYLGISHDEAKAKLSKLLLNNAMYAGKGDTYKKSPLFNTMLIKYAELTEQPTKEF